jgi:DNA-binding XRE family transcriptional regulator
LHIPVTSKLPSKIIDLEPDAHIGLHIRRKRLELGLRQEDVANQIGVSIDCVAFWENGRSKPQVQHMPKIIEFLGYNPVPYENVTIGGRIKNY